VLYVASDQLVDALEHDDLPLFVESAGYILGGAASCSNIDRTRILVATDRVKEISEVSEASKRRLICAILHSETGLQRGRRPSALVSSTARRPPPSWRSSSE